MESQEPPFLGLTDHSLLDSGAVSPLASLHSFFNMKKCIAHSPQKSKLKVEWVKPRIGGKGAIAKQRDEILQKDGRACAAFFPPETIFFISGSEFLSF